jgi:hypothetical protein
MIRMPFTRCQDKYIMHGTGQVLSCLRAGADANPCTSTGWDGGCLDVPPSLIFIGKISPLRMTCSWYVHIGGSRHVKGWSLGCGLRQPQSNHRDIVINNWDFKSILTTSQLGNTVCLHWGNPSKSSKQAEKSDVGFVWIHCRLTKDSQNHQDIGRCKRLKHWWLALAWTATDQNSGCLDRWGIYWTMAI